jgi:hypothetical protein
MASLSPRLKSSQLLITKMKLTLIQEKQNGLKKNTRGGRKQYNEVLIGIHD